MHPVCIPQKDPLAKLARNIYPKLFLFPPFSLAVIVRSSKITTSRARLDDWSIFTGTFLSHESSQRSKVRALITPLDANLAL
jgi:hypothetical protein